MLGGSEMATLREIELMQSLERRDARILELERDAARYRWLRTRVIYDHYGLALPCGHTKVDPANTDKAIDAAMQEPQ